MKPSHFPVPSVLNYHDISIIIPVRDNQEGVNRFLRLFLEKHSEESFPKEVIFVDNLSKLGLTIPRQYSRSGLSIKVVRSNRKGPACARNDGSAEAQGDWLLFTDSDCLPTETFLSGYFPSVNGAIAYAGNIKALGIDKLSRYYDSQKIFVPPEGKMGSPQYFVTANALVWRKGFEVAGGFDVAFPIAGGEDIDLSIRLTQFGKLAYALESCVIHDFGDGFFGFIKRFVRYGIGNRILAEKYGIDLSPHRFVPNQNSVANRILSFVQHRALSWGYNSRHLNEKGNRSVPLQ